ncbi:MAG: response regulator receiver protein [Edaphobacter sp.]|jgi:CheY-like chemotaxis protein|nr:response regulator receiver protein [Edaphobacter sp.]
MVPSSITILCVDDEETPRILRKLILQKQGYQVIAAASGVEALELLDRANINLVLSDQMMPGMSGTELTKSVKAMRPTMPVILISGVNEIPPDASYADRFISKVGGPELLFQTVIEVLTEYGHVD